MKKHLNRLAAVAKRHTYFTVGILLLAIILIGGGAYASYDRILTSRDCTKLEKFDFFDNSCYFECDSDAECEALSKKVEDELNKRFAGSKTIGKTEKKPTAPAQQPAAAPQPQKTDGPLFDKASTGSETNGTVYTVQSDGSLRPQPTAEHQALWALFTKIISVSGAVKSIASFEVYTNANDSSAASVWRSQDPMKWHMNVNQAYQSNRADLVHTLVHEYGHVITLSGNQVAVAGSCPRLQLSEGCATQSSYIQGFYDKFWKKYGNVSIQSTVYAFHQQGPADEESQYPDDQYYGQQEPPAMDPSPAPRTPQSAEETPGPSRGDPNEFVTEYAATNIGEDMAETFAYFVLRPKPSSSAIKDQKIQYYYQFSELVSLRDRMRAAIGNDVLQRNRIVQQKH
jgi:hypothetical protein